MARQRYRRDSPATACSLNTCERARPQAVQWPAWIKQLVLAADQFVVERPLGDVSEAFSVVAGYPWFDDWGRDTMVALPGLLLATGRAEVAAGVLRTYARFVDRGMLPNRFPDAGDAPEYNTVDGALWFIEAVRHYYSATHDLSLVREIFPAMAQIVSEYTRGTRYNIHVDSTDGLLFAGEPGVQLTWMDAKVGDWVVTPRVGKPVEVNALWINALATQAKFAEALGESAASICGSRSRKPARASSAFGTRRKLLLRCDRWAGRKRRLTAAESASGRGPGGESAHAGAATRGRRCLCARTADIFRLAQPFAHGTRNIAATTAATRGGAMPPIIRGPPGVG